MVSFRGQKKVGPRPDWSPLGVYLKISDEHPRLFHMGDLPRIHHGRQRDCQIATVMKILY